MPTNEERRDVAARLRKNEPSSFGSVFDVLQEIVLDVNPNGGSYKTLPMELADLIEPEPERTCKYIWNANRHVWFCSECGGLEPCSDSVNYCCDCGARVIGNIDEMDR